MRWRWPNQEGDPSPINRARSARKWGWILLDLFEQKRERARLKSPQGSRAPFLFLPGTLKCAVDLQRILPHSFNINPPPPFHHVTIRMWLDHLHTIRMNNGEDYVQILMSIAGGRGSEGGRVKCWKISLLLPPVVPNLALNIAPSLTTVTDLKATTEKPLPRHFHRAPGQCVVAARTNTLNLPTHLAWSSSPNAAFNCSLNWLMMFCSCHASKAIRHALVWGPRFGNHVSTRDTTNSDATTNSAVTTIFITLTQAAILS
ncbi:hypothetical protein VNO77_03336 [Canavalia gladiata]|uniref:Uncharacterized protein n=1 Tax=Canavalia gladiata TaxID=3824 RepID=A0AAN9MWJ5_CANGL